MKAFLLWMWLSGGADALTTVIALERGCHEATWPMNQAPYAGLAFKGGTTIALTFTLPLAAKDSPTAAKWAAGIVAGASSGAAVWNLTRLSRCGR